MKVEIEIKSNANCKPSTQRRKRLRVQRKKSEADLQEPESKKQEALAQRTKPFDVIQKVLAVFVAMYPIVEYVYNHYYGQECEAFYHIPAKYFTKSVNSSILYITLLILLLAVPFLGKWFITREKGNIFSVVWDVIITLCYGFALCYVNLLSILKICTSDNSPFWKLIDGWISENVGFFLGIIMGISIITMMGSTMIALLRRINSRILQIVIYAVFFTSVTMSVFILFTGAGYVLNPDPAGKTIYEIADYEGEKYAVLSEYNDKLLVVPATINEDDIVELDTTWYGFVDASECKFCLVDFEHIPQVIRAKNTE